MQICWQLEEKNMKKEIPLYRKPQARFVKRATCKTLPARTFTQEEIALYIKKEKMKCV